jgi:hypothetical protein
MTIKNKKLYLWVFLFLVFSYLSFSYFGGTYTWPIHDYSMQIQSTSYVNGQEHFLDSQGKELPISAIPTSNVPLAIMKWGFALAAVICLWLAVGTRSKSKVGHLGKFVIVVVAIVILTTVIFFRFFFRVPF